MYLNATKSNNYINPIITKLCYISSLHSSCGWSENSLKKKKPENFTFYKIKPSEIVEHATIFEDFRRNDAPSETSFETRTLQYFLGHI